MSEDININVENDSISISTSEEHITNNIVNNPINVTIGEDSINVVTGEDSINVVIEGSSGGNVDLSSVFKLDQTTPQTVVNGIPSFGGLKINGAINGTYAPFESHMISESYWNAAFWNDTYSSISPIFTYYAYDNGKFAMGTEVDTDLAFYTNEWTNERMIIKNNGRVLIGTSTDNTVDMLQVNGSISGSNLSGTNTGDQEVFLQEYNKLSNDYYIGLKPNVTKNRLHIGTRGYFPKSTWQNSLTVNGYLGANDAEIINSLKIGSAINYNCKLGVGYDNYNSEFAGKTNTCFLHLPLDMEIEDAEYYFASERVFDGLYPTGYFDKHVIFQNKLIGQDILWLDDAINAEVLRVKTKADLIFPNYTDPLNEVVNINSVMDMNVVSADNLKNIKISSGSLTTGTVLNNYGLIIEDQTIGTNNYAIKTGLGKIEFGDNLVVNGITKSSIYQSSDGSVGITTTQTFKDGSGNNKTMTIKNGLITNIE